MTGYYQNDLNACTALRRQEPLDHQEQFIRQNLQLRTPLLPYDVRPPALQGRESSLAPGLPYRGMVSNRGSLPGIGFVADDEPAQAHMRETLSGKPML